MKRGEIRALTGLRGIAAVLVMIYHFEWSVPTDGPLTAFVNHGYLCVDLFFVLSGFVMATVYGRWFSPAWTWRQYHVFMAHRIARIYPLYAFVIICIVILFEAGVMTFPPAPTPRLLITNLLMTQTWTFDHSLNAPTWSISTEWAVYIVFPWLFALTNRGGRTWALGLAFVGLAIIAGILALSWSGVFGAALRGPLDISGRETVAPLVRCFVGFTLGLLTWRASRDFRTRYLMSKEWVDSGLAALAFGLLFVPESDPALYLLLPPLVLAMAVGRGKVIGFLGWRPIHFLGVLSFGIYLVHFRAQAIWVRLIRIQPNWGEFLQHVIATTATSLFVIGLAWILYLLIEVPARRVLRVALEPGQAGASEPLTSR